MHKHDIWQLIPYILPILSYLIGTSRNKLRVPDRIRKLLENNLVVDVIINGVQAAQSMKQMTDEQKREYVRAWAKSELYGVLGEWLPDSAVNFLIEHVIVKSKGA